MQISILYWDVGDSFYRLEILFDLLDLLMLGHTVDSILCYWDILVILFHI